MVSDSIFIIIPAGNYMFKVNNRNTNTKCEIFSKLTIKTPEVAIGHYTPLAISIVNFEQVNAGWDCYHYYYYYQQHYF